MTIEEFLEELKKTSFEWILDDKSQIRRDRVVSENFSSTKHCPITSVGEQRTGRYRPIMSYFEVAEEMGLSHEDAIRISIAADKDVGYNPDLRKRLLETVGLEEKITA